MRVFKKKQSEYKKGDENREEPPDRIFFSFLFPGPCQLFKKKQSKLCSEMQKLEQKYGVGKFCNRYKASCNYNITDGPSDRKMLLWKNCYCDSLCEEMGDCCIDYEKWYELVEIFLVTLVTEKTLDQFVFGSSTSILSFFSGNNINPVKKGVIRLATSVGQRKKIWFPMRNQTSYSIYKHDVINIADPSSMQDVCHMNFVIDRARLKVSVAQW